MAYGSKVAAAPRGATRIIRGRTTGRAENETPKTALKVHVDLRRIKASSTLMAQIITYIKSSYLDVRGLRRTHASRPKIILMTSRGHAATFDPCTVGLAGLLRQRKVFKIYAGPNATSDTTIASSAGPIAAQRALGGG